MLVHCRVTHSSMSQVDICTPGWRETMWGKVSCPRKQYNGRDWVLNHRPSDLKSNTLTTTPLRPHKLKNVGYGKVTQMPQATHTYPGYHSMKQQKCYWKCYNCPLHTHTQKLLSEWDDSLLQDYPKPVLCLVSQLRVGSHLYLSRSKTIRSKVCLNKPVAETGS